MPSSTEANASHKTNSTAALHEAAHSLTSTDGLLPKPHISDPSLYFNRELSWLAFNHRVLLEAARSDWPLLERIKFFAIFFSNLDEFFMIRVSALHEQHAAQGIEESPDGLTPGQQLAKIGVEARAQLEEAAGLLAEKLLPELEAGGIHIRRWQSLDDDARRLAHSYFREAVFPVLTPLVVDPVHPFPFLSNLSLSLAVEVRDPETHVARFARVKVPEILPRFVSLEGLANPSNAPNGKLGRELNFLPLEELIQANLQELFPGMEILDCHPFRVTRDMDIEILEEEAGDLLSVVSNELRRRKFGSVVRLELAPGVPERVRRLLIDKLQISERDIYEFSGPLGASSFFSIAQLPRPDLRDPVHNQVTPAHFANHTDIFVQIARGDLMIHLPYETFTPVLDLLEQASIDPEVLAIKMTLYRTGSNPALIKSLIKAAENGKQVAVCVEIKARFDEENNIAWAQALERAGVHVFYGAQGLKTHAKVLMVVRREGDRIARYVHLSTGNYNATTARLYTDLGLFTADPQIAEDVSELFNSLSGFSRHHNFHKLAAGAHVLPQTVLAKIEEQARLASEGKPARIFAKMNALVDINAINALYAASKAGVPIYLVVRGICCLRPGLPGVSDNIRVCSIVGRFLEHNRVFAFGPEGEEEFYLSSADWMPRNFYHRVEVMFPVTARYLCDKLRTEILLPALRDNCRAYDLGPDGNYVRRVPQKGEPPLDAQASVLEAFKELAVIRSATP
ncbi:MAG TPA: polyphosphate kinase 1 [Candidatus Binataceae bacterium]|nr:polyphosphate kinase 1 [Candidatus Binataceae bacterium]